MSKGKTYTVGTVCNIDGEQSDPRNNRTLRQESWKGPFVHGRLATKKSSNSRNEIEVKTQYTMRASQTTTESFRKNPDNIQWVTSQLEINRADDNTRADTKTSTDKGLLARITTKTSAQSKYPPKTKKLTMMKHSLTKAVLKSNTDPHGIRRREEPTNVKTSQLPRKSENRSASCESTYAKCSATDAQYQILYGIKRTRSWRTCKHS